MAQKNMTVLQYMNTLAKGVPFSKGSNHTHRDRARCRIYGKLHNRVIFSRLHNESYEIYGICWNMSPNSMHHMEGDEQSQVTIEDHIWLTHGAEVGVADQPVLMIRNPSGDGPLLLLPELCGMVI